MLGSAGRTKEIIPDFGKNELYLQQTKGLGAWSKNTRVEIKVQNCESKSSRIPVSDSESLLNKITHRDNT